MFTLVKALVAWIMLVSHHVGSGLTGAIAFGFVVYLLDIGGFRTEALSSGGLNGSALMAMAGVIGTFIGANILMKQLIGKHGVF